MPGRTFSNASVASRASLRLARLSPKAMSVSNQPWMSFALAQSFNSMALSPDCDRLLGPRFARTCDSPGRSRASMNDTLLRHWVMLGHIPSGRGIDTSTLVKRLAEAGYAVAPRTVQRDLEKLSLVFPLVCDDRTKPYRWAFSVGAPAFTLPGMSPAVAFAVRMAAEHLAHALPRSTTVALAPYVSKADAVLAASGWTWSACVRLVAGGPQTHGPLLPDDVLDAVVSALGEESPPAGDPPGARYRRRLHFSYRARGATSVTEWEVTALGLVLRPPVLYLIAAADTRPLQFALQRMGWARLGSDLAAVPPFDLDAYVGESRIGYRIGDQPVDLVLRVDAFAAPDLIERPLAPEQRVRDGPAGDGEIIVEATVHDTMDLRAFLLSLGSDAEVLGPKNLREAIASDLRRALIPYRTPRPVRASRAPR